jgi:putative zinc finger protein
MTDTWTDRLSEYLDGELTPGERAALEAHLASCRTCTETLEELRAVVARAGALPSRPPDADLWPGVAERIDSAPAVIPFVTRSPRRFSFTLPQLVAAGLALMVVSGGGVWVLNHGGAVTSSHGVATQAAGAQAVAGQSGVGQNGAGQVGAGQGAAAGPDANVVPASFADPRYDEAIADLQQTLQEGRAQLDPQTVSILEANLDAIDKAIDQSREALAKDPANLYLHNHLADARQRKLTLLRRAVEMVNKG